MSVRRALALSWFVLFALLVPAAAIAQIDTGTIVGQVKDPSGAVLPGVTVTATQEGTGVTSSTVTSDRGEFTFPGQKVGRYTVTAELPGFKKVSYRDVQLNVQGRIQLDFELGVGDLTASSRRAARWARSWAAGR